MKKLELEFVPQRSSDLDSYWDLTDKRKKADREAFDLIIASILATRGTEPRVPAVKGWTTSQKKTMAAIEGCRDLYGSLLQNVSHQRKAALTVHPKAPVIELRQDRPKTLRFRVEGPYGQIWQDYGSVDPERVSLIAGRRCAVVELPWFTREINTAWLRTSVKADAHNGLLTHICPARWDNPDLLLKAAENAGDSLTEDFLKDLQHWSAKAGFIAVWCRSEGGLTLLAPETFESGLGMSFADWWANLTLRIFRKHKLPQLVPYLRVIDPSTGIVSHSIGRDLTLERERAARRVDAC